MYSLAYFIITLSPRFLRAVRDNVVINLCPSQAQNRAAYYSANQLAQLRPSPRWATQGVRPQRK